MKHEQNGTVLAIGDVENKNGVTYPTSLLKKMVEKGKHPYNYVNPLPAEASFREAIGDMAAALAWSTVIEKVKEIAALSFRIPNLFESKYIHPTQKSRVAFGFDIVGGGCDCLIIPLKASGRAVGARLVIAEWGEIEVQVQYEHKQPWVHHPIKSHNVVRAIQTLMPETTYPNCPVE